MTNELNHVSFLQTASQTQFLGNSSMPKAFAQMRKTMS